MAAFTLVMFVLPLLIIGAALALAWKTRGDDTPETDITPRGDPAQDPHR